MKTNLLLLASLALLCGCTSSTSYYQPDKTTSHSNRISPDADDGMGGTGMESSDLRTVSRKMAVSLLSMPEISEATTRPRIALLPVKNETRFIINQDMFTKKIRIELNKNARGKMTFLARSRMDAIVKEHDAKKSGLYSGEARQISGADYFLTGEISGLAKASGGSRSDYIMISFQLIEADTSDIVWEDVYEMKRVGSAGVSYQ